MPVTTGFGRVDEILAGSDAILEECVLGLHPMGGRKIGSL